MSGETQVEKEIGSIHDILKGRWIRTEVDAAAEMRVYSDKIRRDVVQRRENCDNKIYLK